MIPEKSTDQILEKEISQNQLIILLLSILVVALCGIAYELVIATVSSYLLGDSVYQFSITIGMFMFAMGIGSYVSKRVENNKLIERFVLIEILVSLFGGASSIILFLVYPTFSFYKPVMYTLIIIIGILVGLEIPILTRILSHRQRIKESIAHVLSLDYLGALIGSVSFPLLLLPSLGLFRSSFSFGVLNIAIALLNVIVFRKVIKQYKSWIVFTVLIIILMFTGIIYGSHLMSFAEGQLFAHDVLFRKQTPYQRIIVTQSPFNKQIRLYLDGHLQFAELDEYRYHEALVHPIMSLPGSRKRVLILGGGDGVVAREVLKYKDVETIDLVDIDPAVTQLSSQFNPIVRINEGSLENNKVHIYNVDAFNFVKNVTHPYNRVIIDLPDPHNEVLSKLYSVEFYKMIKRAITSPGYVVTQSSSPYFTPKVFWCIKNTLSHAGFKTLSYQVSLATFGQWGFSLASTDTSIPKKFVFNVETKFITSDVIKSAQAFGKDIIKHKNRLVNSIFEPIIYRLYLERRQ